MVDLNPTRRLLGNAAGPRRFTCLPPELIQNEGHQVFAKFQSHLIVRGPVLEFPAGFTVRSAPAFEVRGLLVWGFTGGLLDRLIYLSGWEREWDRSRVLPLPTPGTPGPPGEEETGR